jgi:hypothetical protein
MATIFNSHSKQDDEIKNLFLTAFAGTKVKPLFEEFEKPTPAGVNAAKIENDIMLSNAVFVLLSENVENLKHTRDWINWECGTAKNKDIWVFEPLSSLGKISVVVPRVNHYVVYENNETWREEIRSLVEMYDDSHVVPVIAASAAGGALLSDKDKGGGAMLGALAGIVGLVFKSAVTAPKGIAISCPKCHSIYRIYHYGKFRCPVCNSECVLNKSALPPAQPSMNEIITLLAQRNL